jgi:hypothetical protein
MLWRNKLECLKKNITAYSIIQFWGWSLAVILKKTDLEVFFFVIDTLA